MMVSPIRWTGKELELLDQTKLPKEETWIQCTSYQDVAAAIKNMVVRGAPAIGIAAAFGMALAALSCDSDNAQELLNKITEAYEALRNTRPTAVNLFWALNRVRKVALELNGKPVKLIKDALVKEAVSILEEDVAANQAIGRHGGSLIPDNCTVLTHCNAGALATGGYGTALGVIRAAFGAGKKLRVLVNETRPLLQGARLTAWELVKEGIPATLITDSMAGYFMKRGSVGVVIVGADRIAANGDVANKIGTYTMAVLAKAHNVPFYVAAPLSTIDMETPSGDRIVIEERDKREVTEICGTRIAPEGVEVANPAFDVTPNQLVSAIVTEKGIAYPPYDLNLAKLIN